MIDRIDRLNSLLKQVIAEVIMRDVRNPKVSRLVTVKKVDVARDLRQARVYISLLGTPEEKKQTLRALQSAAGFISSLAAEQIVIRNFPSLRFYIDDTIEHEMRVHELLQKINEEQTHRAPETDRFDA
ncbi:30S ribosome-binding factor RbfA [Rhabdochlamydiaceae symbiont of Dictyostelium giganteum]|uniref:30S ribosome-binding factor RbfA n=1 Tax=Rhabdochlamydiaceae symbiont of Dictyostelium giganteum TaxID=3342349 RepID=UPI00384AC41D